MANVNTEVRSETYRIVVAGIRINCSRCSTSLSKTVEGGALTTMHAQIYKRGRGKDDGSGRETKETN